MTFRIEIDFPAVFQVHWPETKSQTPNTKRNCVNYFHKDGHYIYKSFCLFLLPFCFPHIFVQYRLVGFDTEIFIYWQCPATHTQPISDFKQHIIGPRMSGHCILNGYRNETRERMNVKYPLNLCEAIPFDWMLSVIKTNKNFSVIILCYLNWKFICGGKFVMVTLVTKTSYFFSFCDGGAWCFLRLEKARFGLMETPGTKEN